MKKLYLDDVRNPYTEDWTLVRSYEEFTQHIMDNGVPDEVSFDHDLGTDMTGYDAVKWLGDYCIEKGMPFPKCYVHSANPVGKANILSFIKFINKNV